MAAWLAQPPRQRPAPPQPGRPKSGASAADNGTYTDLLVREGYIGYGGCDWPDLNPCQTRADIFAQLAPLPRFQGKSKRVISAYARMISFPIGNAAAGAGTTDTTAPRRR